MELGQLTNDYKDLVRINEKQEIRVRFYETRAHILAIVHILFQGIILVSISLQSASNQCKRWWVTFTMSLLSSLIFFLAFVDAVKKFYNTQYHLDMNYVDLNIINKQIHEIESTHSVNIGESSSSTSLQKPLREKLKPDEVQLFKRKVYIVVILLALISFTVVMLFACRSFLCNDDSKVSVSV